MKRVPVHLKHFRVLAAIPLFLSVVLSAGAAPPPHAGPPPHATAADRVGPPHGLRVSTLSAKPELVSGGDVLVRIDVPSGVTAGQIMVTLNGNDVTAAFRAGTVPGSLVGLVTGLESGKNLLEARVQGGAGGNPPRHLELVNHPRTGPVISGPQQMPFICETEVFGLGPALDEFCSANTVVDYLYRSSATDSFLPLPAGAPLPADLAETTTSTGNAVPYIVRRETGVINRAVYQIAFLHVPGQPLPDPWTSTPGWNGRLLYSFGGGCAAGYHQGRKTGQPSSTGGPNGVPGDRWLGDYAIARGYAMATSSLNVFGTNCNEVLSAESLMMVKEYFIERFGVPVYTIGKGLSGGSMQQHLIAHSYPGLLDGIIPGKSFPGTLTFLVNTVPECVLLDRAFTTSTLSWSDAQKSAVAGYHSFNYCRRNGQTWRNNLLVPGTCDASVPAALIYDPVRNPEGIRCTYADNLKNVYGVDPRTGFARRAFDNVGIQYGLVAFNAGIITAEQFIDLNARVGGFDIDGGLQPVRSEADTRTMRIAYATGRLNSGGGGLATVPIIDIRTYMDGFDDVHDAGRTDIMRARLIEANGHAGNQVRVIAAPILPVRANFEDPNSPSREAWRDALDAMDRWLANMESDSAPYETLLEKVTRNRPGNLVDACYTLSGDRITDFSLCRQLFPSFTNPRIAAGEPLTQDVLKCRRKPVNRADYAWRLTDAQLARLREIFPQGVCDYGKPGVGQQEFTDTWLAFPKPGFGTKIRSSSPTPR